MQLVEVAPDSQDVFKRVTQERLVEFAGFLSTEWEDSKSARRPVETRWTEALRLYEAIPKSATRNTPIENAPNIEIPLGAIASDAIYAQMVDQVYNIVPIITARETNAQWTEHTKAFQRFMNFGHANEFNTRVASENSFLDTIQLGTGIYYIPWVESVVRQRSRIIRHASPRIFSIPIEDFFVPGGSFDDLQRARWNGMRTMLTRGEMSERALAGRWDVRAAMPAGKKNFVRSERERLGGIAGQQGITDLFEVMNFFIDYDIDGDGFLEDLFVVYDVTSRSIMRVQYNPFDKRPFEAMRYQLRAHLFYGIGVIEMLRSFQEEVTELHNYRLANQLLANTRMFAAKPGSTMSNTPIYPGKVIETPDPQADIKEIRISDIYASAPQAEIIVMQLAERRVGLDSLASPRQNMNRTPATTALSQIQQLNRRFTPAFDAMRLGTAAAVQQCAVRYQERILEGDTNVRDHIVQVMGSKDGNLVIELLQSPEFEDEVSVELTASSATINRQMDRQDMVQFVSIMTQYYQGMLQLIQLSQSPEATPLVKKTALSIAEKAGEVIDRVVRTYDQIRDPQRLMLEIDMGIEQTPDITGTGIEELLNGFAGAQGNGGPPGLVA